MDRIPPEQRHDSGSPPRCSFCGEVQTSDKHMVKGPGVYICEECVKVCGGLIDEKRTDQAASADATAAAPATPPVQAVPPELPPAPSQPPAQPPPPVYRQPPAAEWSAQAAQAPLPPRVAAAIPGEVVVDGAILVPAGFWRRVGAFLIDALVLAIAQQISLAIIGFQGPSDEQLFQQLSRIFADFMATGAVGPGTMSAYFALIRPYIFAGWLNVFICMAYFTVFHGMLGATLGKLCLGLKVLRRDGRPLGYGLAWLRYLGYFIVAKLIYTAWLIPFTAERRTLYDVVLGTNVFRQLAPAPAPGDGRRYA